MPRFRHRSAPDGCRLLAPRKLEPQTDDNEESYAPIAYLADDANEPTRVLEARSRDWLAGDGIALALDSLDPRSRRIVEDRDRSI